MKILVIQLARYGDLFMTIPTLRALRRENPNAEIHLLVRDKFRAAIDHLDVVDCVWRLDSKEILEPTIVSHDRLEESVRSISNFIDSLDAMEFSSVINLSFSPLSSYLVSIIANQNCDVRGYTRFDDGYLAIPDDTSAYFYGQVGIGKSNRIHLAEIFSAVAGVENIAEDWSIDLSEERDIESIRSEFSIKEDYILIHVGASEIAKRYAPFKWAQVIRGIRSEYSGSIVLIGSPDEADIADEIYKTSSVSNPINLVGRTEVREIIPLISSARILVGCDSLPIQVASLTQTSCLNLSFSSVNFWETGPRSIDSRILFAESEVDLTSDRVIREAKAMLSGVASGLPVINRTNRDMIGYELSGGIKFDDYQFNLIEALYMEGEFPPPRSVEESIVFDRLYEVSSLAIEQLDLVCAVETRKLAMDILAQVDGILLSLDTMVPSVRPLLSWFQTERLRLGPGDLEYVVSATKSLFDKLQLICQLFVERDINRHSLSDGPIEEVSNASQEMVK